MNGDHSTGDGSLVDVAALPIGIVFCLITFFIVRSSEVRWWIAALIFLAGFYIALTPLVFLINDLVSWLVGRFAP